MPNSSKACIWKNWAGNQSFTPNQIIDVHCESEVQHQIALAAEQGLQVRTCGAGHSFTPIVETRNVLLNMASMKGVIQVDNQRQRATILPQTPISELGQPLWAAGLALRNQGDIDAQAIAGAIATATHGSGKTLPSFSAALSGARIVDGMGNIVEISSDKNPSELAALQTSLGLLGIMTEVTLDVVPAYDLHLRYEDVTFDEMLNRFDSYRDDYRSFTFFWAPTDQSSQLYCLPGVKEDHCVVKLFQTPSPQLDRSNLPATDRIGRSYEIYPMQYIPNFHEMEYFVPLSEARDVMIEMRKLMRRWLPLSIFPMEIRTVAAENAWMSPNFHRENLVVSVSGQPGTDYWDYLRACDSLFAEFKGRPHWGKLHFMTADRLERLFPHYNDFVAMRQRFDPKGTYLNQQTRPLFT